jgi:hypothetical protein
MCFADQALLALMPRSFGDSANQHKMISKSAAVSDLFLRSSAVLQRHQDDQTKEEGFRHTCGAEKKYNTSIKPFW